MPKKRVRRRVQPPPESDTTLEEFLRHRARAPRPPGTARRRRSTVELLHDDAELRATSGDWQGATGRTFVGLYVLCYRMVYGRLPIDLDDRAVQLAARNATMLMRKHFDDDPDEMAGFVQWTWVRQKGRLAGAERTGREHRRMTVRMQFSTMYAEDYLVASSRRGRGGH